MKQANHHSVRKVVGYCRCSTEEQSSRSDFNTLESQEQFIRHYCALHYPDSELEIIHDVASAKDTKREGLQRLLKKVAEREIQAVIVYKLDRFSRSLKDFFQLEATLSEKGVDFISVKDQFDTSTSNGRFMRNMLAVFAQQEREMTAERVRDKIRSEGLQGRWIMGRPPFGYRVVNKHLEVIPDQAEIVRFAFERFVQTACLSQIVQEINDNPVYKAVLLARGNAELRTDYLKSILTNRLYTGAFCIGKELIAEQKFPALVDTNTFEMVHRLLPRKRQRRAREDGSAEYLLRGVIFCAECGGAMTPYYVIPHSGIVRYYSHPRKSPCKRRRINLKQLHKRIWEVIGFIATQDEFAESMLLQAYTQNTEETRLKVERLTFEIERLIDLYSCGVDVPELSQRLDTLQRERARLSREVKVMNKDDLCKQLYTFRKGLRRWSSLWEAMTLQEKRECMTAVVDAVEVQADCIKVFLAADFESKNRVAPPAGFEPTTVSLEGCCSVL